MTILSMSIPDDLRGRLEAEARRQRRSRSFIVAEAVREYVERQTQRAFAEAREQTLRHGLALTPEARIRLSDNLWHELTRGRTPAAPWVATFGTFAEYEEWRQSAAVA